MAEAAASGRADPSAARLEEISRGSPEFSSIAGLIEERCSQSHVDHYKLSVVVVRLWKVVLGRLQREQQEMAAALGPPTLLFHGTSAANVRPILANGFKLPKHSGMFGRGIYFAHCPLKSALYAQRVAMRRWHYTVGFLVACTAGLVAGHNPCVVCTAGCLGCWFVATRRSPRKQMLLCEVYLGNTRKLRVAKDVKPSEDLKRGWLASIFGAKDYDSIHAPSGIWGAVRVSEYIVYQPHQAIPKYVLEFMEQPLDRQSKATN